MDRRYMGRRLAQINDDLRWETKRQQAVRDKELNQLLDAGMDLAEAVQVVDAK